MNPTVYITAMKLAEVENYQLKAKLKQVEDQLGDTLKHFAKQQENEHLRRELDRLKALLP